MLRVILFSILLLVSACQSTSPYVSEAAKTTYVPIESSASMMAIVNGRTVEYTSQSTRGEGIKQTFYRNGTTQYGSQKRVWSVVNGKYCSSGQLDSDPSQWECFKIDVNEAGTIIRWQRYPDAKQLSAPDGELDTWYGKIL